MIYCDPPWAYANKRTRSSAAKNYPTMKLADLAELKVWEVAHRDAILFLWATAPMLPAAVLLGSRWGFEYKTVAFTWAKRNTRANTAFIGMGNYTRANAEFVLLFVRKGAKPKIRARNVSSFLWSPRLRHSEKPAEIRDRIVRLMGDVPRIELFSRHKVEGWARWGNQLLP